VSTPRQLNDQQLRIARAMRELRRGAAMQRFRDRLYGDSALDMGQHDALEVIVALGEARMGDVATALRVDPSTATRAVARLEDAGLVERRRVDSDARAVVVAPTAAGTELHDEIAWTARAALAELFGRFSGREQHQLADLLDRLVTGLDELVADDAVLPRASVSD
jgi:DNA-binding MarR family transcriptional regulator